MSRNRSINKRLVRAWRTLDLERAASRLGAWFRVRLDFEPAVALLRRKPVPIHRHSWIYCLGDAAVFLFALQCVSGCLLMLYYQPTEASAHESVRSIMTEVPFGWLVRSFHSWGASVFIGTVGLHLVTVLFARAYRRPRELAWVSGVFMLAVALGSGFSGYLLPWNELSYYATLVGTQIPGTLPGVGRFIVHALRGGDQLTGATITRFYAVHVMLAPLAMILLLSFHVFLTRVRGLSLPLGMSQREVSDRRPFFGEFLLVDVCVWLVVFAAIVTLAAFVPAEVGVRADPLRPAPEGIKPEWYFLFAFQTLKMVPEAVGVAFFVLAGVFLLLLPLIDRRAPRGQKSPTLTALFAVGLVYVAVFQILAWGAPGVEHPPEDPQAGSAGMALRRAASGAWLALLWSVVGVLVFYLGQLAKENARVRRLYRDDEKNTSATC
jgi:cytochrome b6